MKIYLQCLLGALVLFSQTAFGQQQVLYTQYMFNGLAINPAYAGTSDALSMSALARWQWVGVEGAPVTQTFSAHAPIRNKKVGVGLTVSMDKIAVTRQTDIFGSYAYHLPMGSGFLSMGLQAGFSSIRANYTDVYTVSPDQTFQDQMSQWIPNFGAGVFYYNSVFYAGLSCPLLLENSVRNGGVDVYTQRRHYFFSSGVVLDLSENVKMKPNVLVRALNGAPLSVDYNVNFLFQNTVWFGVSYRPPESINFLAELNVTKKFRVGYAYDHIIQKAIKTSAVASHELFLNYRISLVKKGVVTPRYF